jgi:hypothetical protein
MSFLPGNPGKPKGAVHSFTRAARETAARLDIDPFEILLHFAAGDHRHLGYDKPIDPWIRCRAAQEAAQYILPKLRAIEQKKSNPLDGMTPEQRLEAMRHAIALLESQAKEK